MTLLLTLALIAGSRHAHGQHTQAELDQKVLGKPLYLRGCWKSDKLKFDGDGKLIGPSEQVPFTVAGIDITSTRYRSKSVLLEGRRVAIFFAKDGPVRMPFKPILSSGEKIHIEIFPDASGSFNIALDAVFAGSLPEMVPEMPAFWQTYAAKHWPSTSAAAPEAPSINAGPNKINKGGVTAPRVLNGPEPQFSTWARSFKMSGNVLVNLKVDKKGMPQNIRIVRPLGLGLDEAAVDAVREYRFAPATRDGEPVAVEMNVEVNFQIF